MSVGYLSLYIYVCMPRSVSPMQCQWFIVQRIRSTIDEKDQKQLLMDLDVVMRSNECPYIVKFYGALFKEVSSTF